MSLKGDPLSGLSDAQKRSLLKEKLIAEWKKDSTCHGNFTQFYQRRPFGMERKGIQNQRKFSKLQEMDTQPKSDEDIYSLREKKNRGPSDPEENPNDLNEKILSAFDRLKSSAPKTSVAQNLHDVDVQLEEELVLSCKMEIKRCNVNMHSRTAFLITFSADGKYMACCHSDCIVTIISVRDGKRKYFLNRHKRSTWAAAFHPRDSDLIATGCLGGTVRVWKNGSFVSHFQSPGETAITSLSFHPSQEVLVIASGCTLYFWQFYMRDNVSIRAVYTPTMAETARFVRFSPCGKFLLTAISNPLTLNTPTSNFSSAINHRILESNYDSHVKYCCDQEDHKYGVFPKVYENDRGKSQYEAALKETRFPSWTPYYRDEKVVCSRWLFTPLAWCFRLILSFDCIKHEACLNYLEKQLHSKTALTATAIIVAIMDSYGRESSTWSEFLCLRKFLHSRQSDPISELENSFLHKTAGRIFSQSMFRDFFLHLLNEMEHPTSEMQDPKGLLRANYLHGITEMWMDKAQQLKIQEMIRNVSFSNPPCGLDYYLTMLDAYPAPNIIGTMQYLTSSTFLEFNINFDQDFLHMRVSPRSLPSRYLWRLFPSLVHFFFNCNITGSCSCLSRIKIGKVVEAGGFKGYVPSSIGHPSHCQEGQEYILLAPMPSGVEPSSSSGYKLAVKSADGAEFFNSELALSFPTTIVFGEGFESYCSSCKRTPNPCPNHHCSCGPRVTSIFSYDSKRSEPSFPLTYFHPQPTCPPSSIHSQPSFLPISTSQSQPSIPSSSNQSELSSSCQPQHSLCSSIEPQVIILPLSEGMQNSVSDSYAPSQLYSGCIPTDHRNVVYSKNNHVFWKPMVPTDTDFYCSCHLPPPSSIFPPTFKHEYPIPSPAKPNLIVPRVTASSTSLNDFHYFSSNIPSSVEDICQDIRELFPEWSADELVSLGTSSLPSEAATRYITSAAQVMTIVDNFASSSTKENRCMKVPKLNVGAGHKVNLEPVIPFLLGKSSAFHSCQKKGLDSTQKFLRTTAAECADFGCMDSVRDTIMAIFYCNKPDASLKIDLLRSFGSFPQPTDDLKKYVRTEMLICRLLIRERTDRVRNPGCLCRQAGEDTNEDFCVENFRGDYLNSPNESIETSKEGLEYYSDLVEAFLATDPDRRMAYARDMARTVYEFQRRILLRVSFESFIEIFFNDPLSIFAWLGVKCSTFEARLPSIEPFSFTYPSFAPLPSRLETEPEALLNLLSVNNHGDTLLPCGALTRVLMAPLVFSRNINTLNDALRHDAALSFTNDHFFTLMVHLTETYSAYEYIREVLKYLDYASDILIGPSAFIERDGIEVALSVGMSLMQEASLKVAEAHYLHIIFNYAKKHKIQQYIIPEDCRIGTVRKILIPDLSLRDSLENVGFTLQSSAVCQCLRGVVDRQRMSSKVLQVTLFALSKNCSPAELFPKETVWSLPCDRQPSRSKSSLAFQDQGPPPAFRRTTAYLCHCRQRLKEGKVKPVCPLKSKGHPDLQVQRKDIFWLHDGADLSDLTCALATTSQNLGTILDSINGLVTGPFLHAVRNCTFRVTGYEIRAKWRCSKSYLFSYRDWPHRLETDKPYFDSPGPVINRVMMPCYQDPFSQASHGDYDRTAAKKHQKRSARVQLWEFTDVDNLPNITDRTQGLILPAVLGNNDASIALTPDWGRIAAIVPLTNDRKVSNLIGVFSLLSGSDVGRGTLLYSALCPNAPTSVGFSPTGRHLLIGTTHQTFDERDCDPDSQLRPNNSMAEKHTSHTYIARLDEGGDLVRVRSINRRSYNVTIQANCFAWLPRQRPGLAVSTNTGKVIFVDFVREDHEKPLSEREPLLRERFREMGPVPFSHLRI